MCSSSSYYYYYFTITLSLFIDKNATDVFFFVLLLSISQWLPCPLAIWNLLFGMAILLNLVIIFTITLSLFSYRQKRNTCVLLRLIVIICTITLSLLFYRQKRSHTSFIVTNKFRHTLEKYVIETIIHSSLQQQTSLRQHKFAMHNWVALVADIHGL